jgi:uncharacterized protein DUF4397
MRSSLVTIRSTILAVVLGLTTACGTDEAAGPVVPTCDQGRARFVNLITDAARNPIDAVLEGVPWGAGLAYTGTTPASLPAPSTAFYSAVCDGSRSVVLQRSANTSVTVATIGFTVVRGEDRTLYAIGGTAGGAVTGFVTTDDNSTAPAAGQTRVRVVNMSPTAGAIDVFLTASPTADLATATPIATNVAYQGTSAYVNVASNVAPATATLRAVPTGTPPAGRAAAVTITQTGIALPAGTGRTFVTADNANGPSAPPFRAFVLSDR